MNKLPRQTAVFAALCSLSACATPSPLFMQADRFDAEVDGTRFTIWQAGESVEVYRTSMHMLPRRSEVFARAEVAIGQATGCTVVPGSLAGDVALMQAELDCG